MEHITFIFTKQLSTPGKRNGSGFSLVESTCLPLTFNSVFQASGEAFPYCNTNILTKNKQFTIIFLDYPQKMFPL